MIIKRWVKRYLVLPVATSLRRVIRWPYSDAMTRIGAICNHKIIRILTKRGNSWQEKEGRCYIYFESHGWLPRKKLPCHCNCSICCRQYYLSSPDNILLFKLKSVYPVISMPVKCKFIISATSSRGRRIERRKRIWIRCSTSVKMSYRRTPWPETKDPIET